MKDKSKLKNSYIKFKYVREFFFKYFNIKYIIVKVPIWLNIIENRIAKIFEIRKCFVD